MFQMVLAKNQFTFNKKMGFCNLHDLKSTAKIEKRQTIVCGLYENRATWTNWRAWRKGPVGEPDK